MQTPKREYDGEHLLSAPLLKFSIDKEVDRLKTEPTWADGDRNAITLQKNSKLRVVLITMRKGASLKEHKVEGPITIFVLSGKIIFSTGDDKINMSGNELIVLEKTIPHDVEALEDSSFILTIIQPK
ncbi:MAG: cupin domain-containing protein [Ignavibacteriaceae bacterium]|nr:cupin domain-containing protein [Ignavibacteriaceae bacterium]